MPQPTVSQVHVNRPLTNISVAFAQAATSFAAERVFPRIPVAKQSDRYFVGHDVLLSSFVQFRVRVSA